MENSSRWNPEAERRTMATQESTNFPPATKITFGVRSDDIKTLTEHRRDLPVELANQIVTLDSVVYFRSTPLRIRELLPASPAIITRLTHLSFEEEDFIAPSESELERQVARVRSIDDAPEVEVAEPLKAPPSFPFATEVALGVRSTDIPTIEKNSDMLLEKLDGIKALEKKTIFFEQVPLLVLSVKPGSPSVINRFTRLSFSEHDFIPTELAPQPEATDTQRTLYLAIFCALGVAVLLLGHYMWGYFSGSNQSKIYYTVNMPSNVPIRSEILKIVTDTAEKRIKSAGIDAQVILKSDERIEIKTRMITMKLESLAGREGKISLRAYTSSYGKGEWTVIADRLTVLEAAVKKGDSGLPEVRFKLTDDSIRKCLEGFIKHPDAAVSVFMDEEKISLPVVKDEIKRGTGIIRDKEMNEDKAQVIMTIMNCGAYPYPVEKSANQK
jgi:hypothetical protein